MAPSMLGSGAGFPEQTCCPGCQTPTRQPLLPTPCPGAPPVPAGMLELRARSPPAPTPTHAGPCPVGASPHPRCRLQDHLLPERSRAVGTSLRPPACGRGPAPSCAAAAPPDASAARYVLRTAATQARGSGRAPPRFPSARHLGPPPRPGCAFVPPPGSRLPREWGG